MPKITTILSHRVGWVEDSASVRWESAIAIIARVRSKGTTLLVMLEAPQAPLPLTPDGSRFTAGHLSFYASRRNRNTHDGLQGDSLARKMVCTLLPT